MSYQFAANSHAYVSSFNEFLGDGSKVTLFCHLFEALATQFLLLAIIYCILFKKNDQILLFMVLRSVEHELLKMPFANGAYQHIHRYLRINSWCIIIGAIFYSSVMFSIYFLILLDNESVSHSLQVLYYLTLTSFYTFIIDYFLQLVTIIGAFYEVINQNLKVFIEKPAYFIKEVKKLMELHQKLAIAIFDLNSSFGVLMLGIFLFVVTILSAECYFAYITAYENLVRKSSRYFVYSVTNLFWPVPVLILLQFLGSTCNKIRDKIYNTTRILGNQEEVANIVDKNLLTLSDYDTRISANGFFVIDNSILFKVSELK